METMKLQDFVSETIKQIVDGVKEAKEKGNNGDARINPRDYFESGGSKHLFQAGNLVEHIEFDVAVTTSEGTQTKGGLGVFVAGIGVGARGKSDASNVSVSRIKFSVPVVLP